MTSAPSGRAHPSAPGLLMAARLIAGPGIRQFLSSKGMIGVGAVMVFTLGMAALLRTAEADSAEMYQGLQVFLMSAVVVPLIALLFGTSAVSSERESGTLPYLFTRPVPRSSVVVGKGVAAIVLANAAVFVTMLLAYVVLGMPTDSDVGLGVIALLLETSAMTGLFVLGGTILARSLYIGLAYIVVYEGFLGNSVGRSPFTLTYHVRNLMQEWSSSRLGDALTAEMYPQTAGASVLMLLLVGLAALVLAGFWVERREYGLRDRPKED